MDNFQDTEDTEVMDVLELEEVAVSRAPTRRRRSSYIGLIPLRSIMDLPLGTELFGPKGQMGYISGHSSEGLVIFDLQGEGVGNRRSYTTVEAHPESFSGWQTSGGVTL